MRVSLQPTMRERAAATVVELFHDDPTVAVVLADVSLDLFADVLQGDPRRAVNVGIMEGTAVGVAAGFALEGFRPVVHTIAPFLAERALEQIKLDFGYQCLEGLFLTIGASYDYGTSGMTHHAPGDVAALSTVPGMEILVPGGPGEAAELVRQTYANGRPTYIRTSVAANAEDRKLGLGGLTLVREGRDLTVIAAGPLLDRTLEAVADIDATVLYATTVVPLDGQMLRAAAAPAAEFLVVEPFYEGTLAPQVTAALAHRPARIESVGVPRRIISRYGSSEEHDRALGLDVCGIRERALALQNS